MTDDLTPDEEPGIPAEDPSEQSAEDPSGPKMTLADLFVYNYNVISPALLGNSINKADGQQYRLKAAEVALQLIAIGSGLRR